MANATMSRSVLVKINWYRTFRPLECVFYSSLARASALRDRLRFFHIFDLVELDGGDCLALGRSRHSPPASKVKTKSLNGALFVTGTTRVIENDL